MIASLILWFVSTRARRARRRARPASTRELAERLAAEGDAPSAELRARMRDPVALALLVGSGVAVARDPRADDLEAGLVILATTRPDSWALPLFLHVLGAMALAGAMTAVTVLALAGLRRPERAPARARDVLGVARGGGSRRGS